MCTPGQCDSRPRGMIPRHVENTRTLHNGNRGTTSEKRADRILLQQLWVQVLSRNDLVQYLVLCRRWAGFL